MLAAKSTDTLLPQPNRLVSTDNLVVRRLNLPPAVLSLQEDECFQAIADNALRIGFHFAESTLAARSWRLETDYEKLQEELYNHKPLFARALG